MKEFRGLEVMRMMRKILKKDKNTETIFLALL